MIKAILKGVEQLGDKRTRGLVWLSLGLALLVFIVLWSSVGFLLTQTKFFELVYLDWAVDILGGLATLILTWLLFPGIMSAFVGLFLDKVADAVEARHYPGLPPADGLPVGESIIEALKFLGVMVVCNLLMLPFLFVPPVFPFVFYVVNGYLLSREYFDLVAVRRLPPSEARRLRKRNAGVLLVTGAALAFMLTVPFLNLVAPVIGTAAMVHLFQKWTGPGRAA
ncbi:MAG: EI24 domain-containing protein [Rhodobacterales bacterium]|nr:EI24 domain-containing protein [Rhodobacterales bacterium]